MALRLRQKEPLSVQSLIESLRQYNPQADVQPIQEAYDFSAKAHAGQKRESGEPFLQHPLQTAQIIVDLKLDVPSIVAGLLHDTIEDTEIPKADLEQRFGKEVAYLVDGVTKIGKIEFKTHEEKQAENFRKMLLSMSEDIRVILIKLADRLHNMRTLHYLPEEKQKRIAQETLDIFAPLANRLGIGWMRTELEDLCLRYLKPEVFNNLSKKVAQRQEVRDAYIQEITKIVQKSLTEYGFKGQVLGRSKHLFGIYQKMERQGIPFEEVYDLAAVRIITDTKMNCYAILGMIHSLWRPVPGRFKDYIGVPKSNGYQSLHTTVVGPKGFHVEFQIRTEEMHRVAEEGIAAHWKYKEKGQIDQKTDRVFGWLRQLVEWQQDLADNRQFMDSVKMDLFPDVIYVFTPKGDVKELAKGSCPLDFAYSVHTEIGNHCTGAKVNGKLVPLRHVLHSGDSVEVTTSPSQAPSKDWLKWVRTARAKTKIKHMIKTEERIRSLEVGKKLLEKALQRHHLSSTEAFKPEHLSALTKDFGIATPEDLLVAIGYGRITTDQVIRRLQPAAAVKEGLADKFIRKIGGGPSGVKVKGIGDLMVHLSKCCNPVPGDPIIGFVTRGRGLSVHTMDCPNIDELDYDKDRIVEVDWDTKAAASYPVKIGVVTVDRPGMLASVSAAITSAKANISHADITTTEDRRAILNFVVEILNAGHLEKVLKGIEKVDGVVQARRVRTG
ncbi:MAG TPA: bifunctional (p)ppGpp synthetase/guanosine-3',5'-bis(diphosphate) 3'-pyrophosphohydrolase [Nitrospiria bacterium]|nr:bifunctional (p)ppGpp synthetase/guanosine-3',5'-bis(diphosphate) 3'-pyrophosphohydrolase [Nitrospiria bacterium]